MSQETDMQTAADQTSTSPPQRGLRQFAAVRAWNG